MRDDRRLRQLLAESTRTDPTTGCILWEGRLNPGGYGRISMRVGKRRWWMAHRIAYELASGPIPDGLLVMHRCDVRNCVNPDHLRLGTQSDNIRDMYAKGRDNCPRGVDRRGAKLNPAKVLAIRADPRIQREIAADYGISQSVVAEVRQGKAWAHVRPSLLGSVEE